MFERGRPTYTWVPTMVKGDFDQPDGSVRGGLAAVVPLTMERASTVVVERADEDPVDLDGGLAVAGERDGPVRDAPIALDGDRLERRPEPGWDAALDPRADDLLAPAGGRPERPVGVLRVLGEQR